MPARRLPRLAAAVLGMLLSLATFQAVAASPAVADPAPRDAVTVVYDASQAGEFVDEIDTAAALWNSVLDNVELVPGDPSTIQVYVDNGWPRAYVQGLGRGYMYMGYQAINQGYYVPRIATHELGHLLGLPDRRTGLCSDLMSGSSAPVSCTNDRPSAAEIAEVDGLFAGRSAAAPAGATVLFTERPAAREQFTLVG